MKFRVRSLMVFVAWVAIYLYLVGNIHDLKWSPYHDSGTQTAVLLVINVVGLSALLTGLLLWWTQFDLESAAMIGGILASMYVVVA
jgi:hypothetical protein